METKEKEIDVNHRARRSLKHLRGEYDF